jgi:hypothetical protein
MAISGLVVTLSDKFSEEAMRASLATDERLTVGECFDGRVALVAETPSVEADRALWEDLWSMPGVRHVDVTYVYLEGESQSQEDPHAQS